MKTQTLTGRLAPFRFMESPLSNGIAFNGKPEAPAFVLAGVTGQTVIDLINSLSWHRRDNVPGFQP